MDMIRIWKEIDPSQIEGKLVLLDDIQGFCPSCKKTGIPYDALKACPSCLNEFKYAALREKGDSASGAKLISKISKKAPWLTIIDYDDYKRIFDRNKTASLFKNIGSAD
jgi:predicted amidophosphoribosyltransferase